MSYVVSTDVGGTFVDCAVVDPSGRVAMGKAPSTPTEPALGVINAVARAAHTLGVPAAQVFRQCRVFLNGTTVTTNAMLLGTGARTGLLITSGFEDTLIIGRVLARTAGLDETRLMDYRRAERPEPVAPIELTRGIDERVDYRGRVLRPLDLEQAERAVDELVQAGVEAVAVCLLWSFQNPTHEQMLVELIRRGYPRLYVSASSELVPLIREYERANTTAVNAYVGPILDRYLRSVEQALGEQGYPGEPLAMQSIGGLAPAEQVRRVPVTTLYSGPVGGVIGAMKLGQTLGLGDLITTDMGGTSFDVGLVVGGEPQTTSVTVMARNILMFPAVDIASIGAGGGSVAWIEDGVLKVGPRSQGAFPGPACYGLGGDLPTVTDADVVLGYINPDNFLGGQMRLSAQRAREAIQRHVADPLGLSVEVAARGIYDIVNAHMADLIRKATVERGYDPRQFTLVAYGGCGPVHCAGYAAEIGLPRALVPNAQTVFSALGIALADTRHAYSRSCLVRLPRNLEVSAADLALLDETFRELEEQATEQLHRDGIAEQDAVLTRSLDTRYRDQVHELSVPVPGNGRLDGNAVRAIVGEFTRRYERHYGPGAASRLADMEVISLRVDAWAPTLARVTLAEQALGEADPAPARLGTRPVYWPEAHGYAPTPTYQGERLMPGNVVAGPAVVELYGTSIPVPAGQHLTVDRWSNFGLVLGG